MNTIIGIVILGGLGYVLYKMLTKKESVQDAVKEVLAEAKAEAAVVVEKVEEKAKEEVAAVAKKVKTKAKAVADVNGDGKVNVADVVEAVKKTRGRKKKA